MEEQKEIVAEYIKCESCGANMQFNPTTQTLYCESCGTQKDFEKDRQVQELAIAEAFSSQEIFDKELKKIRDFEKSCQDGLIDYSLNKEKVKQSVNEILNGMEN